MRFISLLPLLLLLSCGSPALIPQGSLATQILRPRAAYPGMLTNQTCGAYAKNSSTCLQELVIKYDITDQATRDKLRQLGFVCKMGGKQYHIDAATPRLFRTTSSCNWFTSIFGCQSVVTYLAINPFPPVTCFSPTSYDWDSIN